MKLIKWVKLGVALSYLFIGGIVLLITRNNYKPIYKGLRYFLEHESYQISLRKLMADPKFKELVDTKYNQFKPVPWNELAKMKPGTLGYEFAKFMNNPDVTPLDKLPEAKTEISPEIDYIRARVRLTHDIHHVICGYPANELGECGISAVYVAQVNSALNAIVMAVGLVKCTIKWPHRLPELMTTISEGWKMGQTSQNIMNVKWEEMWNVPVTQIRNELHLEPSALDFITPVEQNTPGLTLNERMASPIRELA